MPTTAARNFNYFTYASDDGRNYNIKADQAWGQLAASGGTAAGANAAYGRPTRRRRPRTATFRDGTSFRTFRGIAFTTAAYNAIAIASTTVSRQYPGTQTVVTFTCFRKDPERIPTSVIGRQDTQETLAT